jgi:hypothetical protein
MANLKNVDRFLNLVRTVVADAGKKKGVQINSMTLAVLNNRLLQKTSRRFNPRDYGAKDLRELLETLRTAFELTSEIGSSTVIFRNLSLTSADFAKALPSRDFAEGPSTAGRVRDDLWMAIMDYSSGNQYVWDERRGIARKASKEDRGIPLPTVTPEELGSWRSEFLSSTKSSLAPSDLALANRWLSQRLPTSSLPSELQQSWNRELNRRARQRLSSFFSSRESVAQDDGRDQKDTVGIDAGVDEELAAALDSGDFFPVGELLARRANQNSPEAVSLALAKIVAAWSTTKGPLFQPKSMTELIGQLDSLPSESVALSLVSAIRRLRKGGIQALDIASDLNFRLQKSIASAFGIAERRSPNDTCNAAVAKLEGKLFDIVPRSIDF